MLSLLWEICDIIGLIFIIANGQILKNNITIWSHLLLRSKKLYGIGLRCFTSLRGRTLGATRSWRTRWTRHRFTSTRLRFRTPARGRCRRWNVISKNWPLRRRRKTYTFLIRSISPFMSCWKVKMGRIENKLGRFIVPILINFRLQPNSMLTLW